jgi:hypothetical protein
LKINLLSGEQQRQLIDTAQVFEAWRLAEQERQRRFSGSMRWVERDGKAYLLRKIGNSETSLGPRNAESEESYSNFQTGRKKCHRRLAHLSRRLDEMAPVNKAMGLGRVPVIAARILRECDRKGLLGRQIIVVGTNALFAYEARAGLRLSAGLVATGDMDFLLDARRRLTVAAREISTMGLLGLLRKIDRSFEPRHNNDFRVINEEGYSVDLIRPEPRNPIFDPSSDRPDDLAGAPIEGLGWLLSAPRLSAAAIDENGYPVQIICVDPRIFALHKMWLSGRADRDPLKKQRDRDQAAAAAEIAITHLGLSFEDEALNALPKSLREQAAQLEPYRQGVERGHEGFEEEPTRLSPKW